MINKKSSVYDLMQSVAKHLVGKPVVVRFKMPNKEGSSGMVYKDSGGNIIINLKPGIHDEHIMLNTFCCGCAHALYYAEGLSLLNMNPPAISNFNHSKYKSTTPEAYKTAFTDFVSQRWIAYVRTSQSGEKVASFEDNLRILLQWEESEYPK